MWNCKDNRIQDNSVRSCNGREAEGASLKDPGFSRGNLFCLPSIKHFVKIASMVRLGIISCLLLSLIAVTQAAFGQSGFSIRGGLLFDRPVEEVYSEMEPGIGYMGSFGYDFIERIGLEIGVMHSTHDYYFALEGNAVLEEEAEKNAIFFKARAIPWKIDKAELVIAAGPALFDISGLRRSVGDPRFDVEEDFSGWGIVAGLDFRYHVSPGLAVTFYLSGNFVNYDKYSQFRREVPYPGSLPRGGDSVSWAVTVFHRIGKPKL